MSDSFLIYGSGIENAFGLVGFPLFLSEDFSGTGKKSLIPPFESEILKAEKKTADKKSGNRKNRLPEILLVLAFIIFDLAVFSLCYFLPE